MVYNQIGGLLGKRNFGLLFSSKCLVVSEPLRQCPNLRPVEKGPSYRYVKSACDIEPHVTRASKDL